MTSVKFKNYQNMDSFLESIKLEKHKEIFHKHVLNWDMFVQLSLDDLKKIGVNDEEDRKLIYNELRSTAEVIKDAEAAEKPELTLDHFARHLKEVARSLVLLKSSAENLNENVAVDSSHSAASTVVHLCDLAFNSANLIQSDLKQIAKIRPKRKNKTKWILGSIIVISLCFLAKQRLLTKQNVLL